MSSRQRKPPVRPEKRVEWLDRADSGESATNIAKTDGFDPRTVRKHIDVARQEKETKDARASVFRNALERHYDDLARAAQRLAERSPGALAANPNEISWYQPELIAALREHVPRSKIWPWLSEQSRLSATISEFTQRLNSRIDRDVPLDSRLSQLDAEEDLVVPGIVAAFHHQAPFWLRGYETLNAGDNLRLKPAEEPGFVELSYGAFGLGKVRSEHVELVREVILDLTAQAKEWDEVREAQKASKDLEGVRASLHQEVAVIALRRVVPGRCRYCPA